MFEMECTFENFDVELLKLPVPYKYVVYSPKAKKDDDRYEYLHAHASAWHGDYNRCLFIRPEDRPSPGGSLVIISCCIVKHLFALAYFRRISQD